jgi:threonine synthase
MPSTSPSRLRPSSTGTAVTLTTLHLEGKKTAAAKSGPGGRFAPKSLERALSVFVSVGDGNIISGLHKGFKDLLALGWLDAPPRLFGVQAVGSAAIANAFAAGREMILPVKAQTIADSISVDLPRDGVRAVRAARDTGGSYITVSDEEILAAIAALGPQGIFAEPAGATAYAGLAKAVQQGLIGRMTPCWCSSLRAEGCAAMQAVPAAPVIEPHLTR